MVHIGYFLLLLLCISANIIDGMSTTIIKAGTQLPGSYLPMIDQENDTGSDTEKFLKRENIFAPLNPIVTVDETIFYNTTQHTQPQQSSRGGLEIMPQQPIPQNFLADDEYTPEFDRKYFPSLESCDESDETESPTSSEDEYSTDSSDETGSPSSSDDEYKSLFSRKLDNQ